MERYTVTIVSPGTTGARPVLLVPFQPTAIVTAFIDELWKRIARQSIQLSPNTHIATLHLDSETGGIIDYGDVLSDVVTDPKNDKLFAVFAEKAKAGASASTTEVAMQTRPLEPQNMGDAVTVRIVTPKTAKNRDDCPTITIPLSATVQQLHDRIAHQLGSAAKIDDDADQLECNCKLAKQLADDATEPKYPLVVHGKSVVERLELDNPTEACLKASLRAKLGVDVEVVKRVELIGAEGHAAAPNTYKKPPVVAICSKQRHTPVHARVDIDETGQRRSKVLDLHTSELPIHPSSMSCTVNQTGIIALAIDGIVDIFAVDRTTTGKSSIAIGKSSIFRSRAHWEPRVVQSNRGVAMILSSLRVFTSLVVDMKDDERTQDAVLHVFDLLTKFPPALRALRILVNGKTPNATESAALSQAVFEVLDNMIPATIIGSDHTRVFEGARLFFGFVLEKARTLKLPEEDGATLPYLNAFKSVELRDHKTNEAVMYAVRTSKGLVEARLFEAFAEGGILVDSCTQSFLVKEDVEATTARQAMLSGGTTSEITIFSLDSLLGSYRYRDGGDVTIALDLEEMSELNHLAELCGRNKLAVHKPSQLASAVAPCLTFDRNAHLGVYTGEQPCGDPGQSSLLFRPQHGEETMDAAVVEQLIAPILQGYEADGTAVFDALGGATVRRLQAPDEILMFAVDCSASMRQATDFAEVNDDVDDLSEDSTADNVVEPEFYNRASFDDMKERLCEYEGFDDMLAIVAATTDYKKRTVTSQIVEILRTMLSSEIVKKAEDLENRRQYARGWYYARQELPRLEGALKKLKTFWAGLKTHEQAVCDFLIYRASSLSSDITQRWTWSIGDAVPSASSSHQIPMLPEDVTDLPHHIRCPVSHTLMENAVNAADGHVYAHGAIASWFAIRKSSPMTGLPLNDTSLNTNEEICNTATLWAEGDGIPGRVGGEAKRMRSSNDLEVTFDSRVGSFTRSVSPTMKLDDLYKLAFRGLKAKFMVFQLSTDRFGPFTPSPEATIASRNIRHGDHITIRIADDAPSAGISATSHTSSGDPVLVKVFEDKEDMLFGFWVSPQTVQTLVCVIWKYWRYQFGRKSSVHPKEKQVWTDMNNSGDGLLTGSPRETTEKLSTYLTRRYCFGILGAEKVYREEGGVLSGVARPMVLKVKISPPWKQSRRDNRLTRLDVLKQMFEALINRTLAYNYKTHVGLVTFASTPRVAMGISHVIENFRRSIADMKAEGDTALWDALALAKDQLVEYGKKYPEAKKRIICISDGADTKSLTNTSSDICWRLRQAGIAVDTVSLSEENNLDLRNVSHLLGSYLFHPTSLVNALAICEMEPFLSTTERPAIEAPRGVPTHRLQFMAYFWTARYRAATTIVTSDRVPPRKEHPNLHDEFVQLAAMASRPRTANTIGNSRSNLRTSRLLNEMRAIVATGDHPKYDVYVSESDMSFWKVVMDGPEDSPYSEGTFLLYLAADEGYPTFAPKARFITKIKHPNVNAHGRICHSIFDRDWTSDVSMTTLLDTVYGLLYQPEYSDPVNTTTTLGFHHDQVEFADEVREHVDMHASKSREEWKQQLLGEVEEDVDSEERDEDEDEMDYYEENDYDVEDDDMGGFEDDE